MVPELQKTRLDNAAALYTRPAEIVAILETLADCSLETILQRGRITDRSAAGYIPSECLLHLLRRAGKQTTIDAFEELFKLVRQRVLRALPPVETYVSGDNRASESASAGELRDAVLFRFQELLCRDRAGYEQRLDFFEIRFDMAIARLRLTARRKLNKLEYRSAPLSSDEESNEPSAEVEAALARLQKDSLAELVADDYRNRLLTAIDSLPTDQRRVIELLLQGIPIDSQDPTAITIVGTLKCSEKTVRNRRDRAYSTLRNLLSGTKGRE